MAKKEPLQMNNKPAPKPVVRTNSLINKPELKKALSSSKVTETALSAGYRFKARNPEADPRYPCQQQLMVGPIPGKMEQIKVIQFKRKIISEKNVLIKNKPAIKLAA